MKIVTIFTYALESFSSLQTYRDLTELDKIKARFIKRLLGVHTIMSSTFCYFLVNTPTLSQEVSFKYQINETAWTQYSKSLQDKAEIFFKNDYLSTPAFTTNTWRNSNQKFRDTIIKLSFHGFHHLICTNKDFHTNQKGCTCKFCHLETDHLHIMECQTLKITSINSIKSLSN